MLGNIAYANVANMQFHDCEIGGKRVGYANISSYQEDALVLCFSYSWSRRVCQRLGKKFTVEITNFNLLLESLNGQLGLEAQMGPVTYTKSRMRDHFHKNILDAWQEEYRLVWPSTTPIEQLVQLSTGVARIVR